MNTCHIYADQPTSGGSHTCIFSGLKLYTFVWRPHILVVSHLYQYHGEKHECCLILYHLILYHRVTSN